MIFCTAKLNEKPDVAHSSFSLNLRTGFVTSQSIGINIQFRYKCQGVLLTLYMIMFPGRFTQLSLCFVNLSFLGGKSFSPFST